MAVHVDYDQVSNSVTQMQSGKSDMEAQLGRLQAMITNLVGSGFKTDLASPKFQESYTQWNTGAKNVMQGLDGMAGFLKNVISQHHDLDSSLSSQTQS